MAKKPEKKKAAAGTRKGPYTVEQLTAVTERLRVLAASVAGHAKAMEDLEVQEILVGDAMLLRSIDHIETFIENVGRGIREQKIRKGIL